MPRPGAGPLQCAMKLTIRAISTDDAPDLRAHHPVDDTCFTALVTLAIGPHTGRRSDDFSLLVATPAGLAARAPERGVLAAGPLLVLERYDFDALWDWLSRAVRGAELPTWPECVEALRRHFRWEYEGYRER